jgi:hypothetical protein
MSIKAVRAPVCLDDHKPSSSGLMSVTAPRVEIRIRTSRRRSVKSPLNATWSKLRERVITKAFYLRPSQQSSPLRTPKALKVPAGIRLHSRLYSKENKRIEGPGDKTRRCLVERLLQLHN